MKLLKLHNLGTLLILDLKKEFQLLHIVIIQIVEIKSICLEVVNVNMGQDITDV